MNLFRILPVLLVSVSVFAQQEKSSISAPTPYTYSGEARLSDLATTEGKIANVKGNVKILVKVLPTQKAQIFNFGYFVSAEKCLAPRPPTTIHDSGCDQSVPDKVRYTAQIHLADVIVYLDNVEQYQSSLNVNLITERDFFIDDKDYKAKNEIDFSVSSSYLKVTTNLKSKTVLAINGFSVDGRLDLPFKLQDAKFTVIMDANNQNILSPIDGLQAAVAQALEVNSIDGFIFGEVRAKNERGTIVSLPLFVGPLKLNR